MEVIEIAIVSEMTTMGSVSKNCKRISNRLAERQQH